MRLRIAGIALVAAAMTWGGCASAMQPVSGFIYSDVRGPLDAAGMVQTTPSADAKPERVGQAMCSSILGWVARGDAGIEAAMRDGGITRIHHVDHKSWSILGVYAEFTTVVYGDAGEGGPRKTESTTTPASTPPGGGR